MTEELGVFKSFVELKTEIRVTCMDTVMTVVRFRVLRVYSSTLLLYYSEFRFIAFPTHVLRHLTFLVTTHFSQVKGHVSLHYCSRIHSPNYEQLTQPITCPD